MSPESIGIIFNPLSGSGNSNQVALDTKLALEKRGYKLFLKESKASYHKTEILAYLRSVDIVLVAGGDGTLAHLLPALAETERPVFMLPTGNESLFSRQFGMSRDLNSLFERIESMTLTKHFFGRVNAHPFFSMVSLGLDSEVVAAVARARTGPIGHRGYVIPTLKALMTHRPPELTITVNGDTVVSNQRGFLIVANTSQYAMRIPLVPEADSEKGELVARFFPGLTRRGYLRLFARGMMGKSASSLKHTKLFRGNAFEVTSSILPYPAQADGESIGATPLHITASKNDYILVLNRPQPGPIAVPIPMADVVPKATQVETVS